jgi:hypothetical protein
MSQWCSGLPVASKAQKAEQGRFESQLFLLNIQLSVEKKG